MAEDGNRFPSPEEVLAALDQAGHLLEQQVATQLDGLGYKVSTGRAYADSDEGKSRELDVVAHKRLLLDESCRLNVGIQLLIECKNGAAPFAFLTRPTFGRRKLEEVQITCHTQEEPFSKDGQQFTRRTRTFEALGLAEKYWGTSDAVKAVHISRLDRKNGTWSANNNGVFDSLTWPMAKALRAFRKPYLNPNRAFDAGRDWSHVQLHVPIVVVASRLFVADGTSDAPTVREQGHVRFQREFKAKDFEGVFEIDFVQRDFLATFVQDTVDAFGRDLVAAVEANRDLVIPKDKWPMADIW